MLKCIRQDRTKDDTNPQPHPSSLPSKQTNDHVRRRPNKPNNYEKTNQTFTKSKSKTKEQDVRASPATENSKNAMYPPTVADAPLSFALFAVDLSDMEKKEVQHRQAQEHMKATYVIAAARRA